MPSSDEGFTRTVNRRSNSTTAAFRIPSQKRNRLRKWKRAASNWLNGLPVNDEDDDIELSDMVAGRSTSATTLPFSISIREGIKNKRRKLLRKLKGQRGGSQEIPVERLAVPMLLKAGSQTSLLKGLADPSDLAIPMEIIHDLKQPSRNFGGTNEMEREPVRIIHLPPDPVTATLGSHKNDDIKSCSISNEIRTAKYTIWNFIPKNFFEQMRRAANIYFLLIVFLQCFSAVSNYPAYLAAIPIMLVLTATAIKDAIEDWKRHNQDDEVNYSVCFTLNRPSVGGVQYSPTRWIRFRAWFLRMKHTSYVYFKSLIAKIKRQPLELSGKYRPLAFIPDASIDWRETYWRDIRVGDIVILRNNEMIPADMILLSSSEPQGVCFVETKNLDGETNLKVKHSAQDTSWIRSAEEAYSLRSTTEVELPSSNLYAFHGKMIIHNSNDPKECKIMGCEESCYETPADNDAFKEALRKSIGATSDFFEPAVVPINQEGLLLRGCMIRNTEYAIGVVVYTGSDTKIMMNSGVTPSKRTRIERQVNPQIILNFGLLFIICLSCAVVQTQFSVGSALAPYWVSNFQEDGLYSSDIFLGFLTFWSSLILFQTLVPISMYITVEFIKTMQVRTC